jgi:hypothetical protein
MKTRERLMNSAIPGVLVSSTLPGRVGDEVRPLQSAQFVIVGSASIPDAPNG